MTKSCPQLVSVHLCYLQWELHRYPSLPFASVLVAGGFTELKLRVSLKLVAQPYSPPKCSETQFLQGAREAKGGC